MDLHLQTKEVHAMVVLPQMTVKGLNKTRSKQITKQNKSVCLANDYYVPISIDLLNICHICHIIYTSL